MQVERVKIEYPETRQKKFRVPVVLESICYRTRAKQQIHVSNTTGGLEKIGREERKIPFLLEGATRPFFSGHPIVFLSFNHSFAIV